MFSFSSSSVHGLQRSTSMDLFSGDQVMTPQARHELSLGMSFDDCSGNMPYPPHYLDGLVHQYGPHRSYDSDSDQCLASPPLFSSSTSISSPSSEVSPFRLDGYSSLDDDLVDNTADVRIGHLHQQQPSLVKDEVHEAKSTCWDAPTASTSDALNITSAHQVEAASRHRNQDNNINYVHQAQPIHLTEGIIPGDVPQYVAQFNAPMVGHLDVPADLIKPGRTYRAEVRFEPVDPALNVHCDEMHYVDFGFSLSRKFSRADGSLPLHQQQMASNQVNSRRPMSFDCLIQPGLRCIDIGVRMLLAVRNAGGRKSSRLPAMRMTISLYEDGNNHSLVHWAAVFHGGRRVKKNSASPARSSRSPKRGRDEDSAESNMRSKMTGGKGGKSTKKPRSK